MNKDTIILASGSRARNEMLKEAGITFQAIPADIDEGALKEKMSGSSLGDIAAALAKSKAMAVSSDHQDAIIIGSDQILSCEGNILSKAKTTDEAREKLQYLRGKTHHLTSAVCVTKAGQVTFEHCDSAALTMNDFDDDFLDDYISKAGDALTSCVGAYALESHGKTLFKEIKGDYHVILGMPLEPLLQFLSQGKNE